MNSSSIPSKAPRLPARELAMLALMTALMMGLKLAMASLPNIEPVSLLIICGALVFGWKSLYSVAAYILLEGLFFGFGLWWFSYIYIWPLLTVGTLLLRHFHSYWLLTALSAGFGLIFGALCAIPFFITGGWAAGFSYWVSGIPFDLLHCAGNAVLAALLLKPLHKLISRLAGGAQTSV